MNKIHNFQSELLKKVQLTENIYHLEYTVPETFVYTPGQFVGARVIPTHTRAYSIVEVKDNILTLLVDVKPQGIASKYFEVVDIGESTNLLGPYGIYKTKDTDFAKVFISTGTGIAPFVCMIKNVIKNKPEVEIYNFFGSQTMAHEVSLHYFKDLLNPKFKYVNCITREDVLALTPISPYQEIKKGRVTQVIPACNFDYLNTEFYICGSHEMVNSMSLLLNELGANKIYVEKY